MSATEIVTHIVAADDDEYQAVGDSINPLDEWSGIEAPRLDTIKIATLHSLLTGDPLQVALDLYEPVYVAENETVVLRIADELMEKLATLDEDELENVAIDGHGDGLGHVDAQRQALFVWMCLLQD